MVCVVQVEGYEEEVTALNERRQLDLQLAVDGLNELHSQVLPVQEIIMMRVCVCFCETNCQGKIGIAFHSQNEGVRGATAAAVASTNITSVNADNYVPSRLARPLALTGAADGSHVYRLCVRVCGSAVRRRFG